MTRHPSSRIHVGFLLAVMSALSGTSSPVLASPPTTASQGGLAPPGLLVFGAASLSDALEEADRVFTQETGIAVTASFAASSVLARQIESGAPADLFFSADLAWVDYLKTHGLVRPGSQRNVLGNSLVLIAPADSTLQLQPARGFDLAGALGGGRLALGDPDSVPAGEYARAALTGLGVWPSVATRLARGENVRAALAYVARGEAPLGIVYRSDAQAERRVRVVGEFPADSHPPIVYPLVLTVSARPGAERLAQFLSSASARQIFARYGFLPPPGPRAPAQR
jgi:molybdate transport system substrate-binding protein